MATNHQISSNGYDRYHGAVKAKELHSQKQPEHGNMHTVIGEEGSKFRPIHDGFDRSTVGGNSGPHQLRDKIEETGRGYDKIDRNGKNDKNGLTGKHGAHQGATQTYQFTQITITHSVVFSGAHLGSLEKSNEAHQNFLNAALNYIKKPSEQAYKSLNDAMTKLMDPRFVPSTVGGAAQVSIRNVNGATMAKFTMEVTPAPTKSLEEAREDLKNAFSTKRDGEKDIASIRAEAHANYIRALSEKFKKDGVISHTNNTPTTPVFKSSVITIVKVTQVNAISLHEIKKPQFNNNLFGRLTFKNQSGFWNNYRKNNKSYVDMMKHDSRKSHINKDFEAGKSIEARHDYRSSSEGKEAKRDYRSSGEGKVEKTGHKHHHKARADKAS